MLTRRLGGQKWQSKWLVKDEVLEEKGEKAGAEGKMAEAEKLKERETAADKQQQQRLIWRNKKKIT